MKEKMYANAINLAGLWSAHPMKMKYDKDIRSWWDPSNNLEVHKFGEEHKYGITIFSSKNKRDVELWTMGVLNSFTMIRNFVRCKE